MISVSLQPSLSLLLRYIRSFGFALFPEYRLETKNLRWDIATYIALRGVLPPRLALWPA